MALAPDEKAAAMAKMTEEVRRMFALPESEFVIQDYHCSLFRTAVYVQGHMWITPGYVLFHSSVPSITESFAFRKITEIKKEKTQLVFPGISVTLDGKQHLFSSFTHRDESLLLIHYIWKHPIVYINVDNGGGGFSGSVSPRPGSSAPSSYGGGGGFTSAGGGGGFTSAGAGGRPGSAAPGGGGGFTSAGGGQAYAGQQVDTQTSRNLVRIANESKQMGMQTNTMLAQQAEQLDRIEYNLDSMNANLDKAERHLRGIHSIGGALRNHYTEDKTKNNAPVFVKQDRTVKVEERQLPDVDYDILYKHKDDSLSAAILRFSHSKWAVLDSEKKTPLKAESPLKGVCEFPYDQVDKLVMRARPQHMDVRFKGSTDKYNRIRLLTSDLQFICNEFFLRTKPNCPVDFEPGVRKFEYGSSSISKTAASASGTPAPNAFLRTQQAAKYSTGNLMQNEANRTAMKQVDDDLDEVHGIVGDLKAIARAQGTEIDRSIEHLDRLNIKADQTNQRIAANNKKIAYEIKHN